MGTVLGLALLDTIAAAATTLLKGSGFTPAAALVGGFRLAFGVSAVAAVAGVLVAAFVIDKYSSLQDKKHLPPRR